MADPTEVPEDMDFDPSLKKKKKKKKGVLELDDAAPVEEAVPAEELNKAVAAVDLSDDNLDDEFASTKKKKKKKKIAFDMSGTGESVPAEKVDDEPSVDAQLDEEYAKKKPKKTKVVLSEDVSDSSKSSVAVSSDRSWAGSDRDYTYDELLTRVFDIMREKNPDIVGGDRKKLTLRPPQVVRVGTRKTSFVNFYDLAKLLRRQPKHLMAYVLSELGTNGNIDGNNQLIIKGRFQPKHMESILRRYIKEYVTCHTCKSPDTELQKDTRLFFLQCQSCRSRCSVANIKSGFQAVTGRRAALRAKTA